MSTVNGGIVLKTMPFPRKDRLAVRGTWTGGEWTPGESVSVHVFSGQIYSKAWRLMGVDYISRGATENGTDRPHEIVLVLAKEANAPAITAGDIIVFGDGAFTIFNVRTSMPPLEERCVYELGERSYRAIFRNSKEGSAELVVFHEIGADLELSVFGSAKHRSREHKIELSYSGSGYPAYTVEFCFGGDKVAAGRLIETLSHARSFVLMTGQAQTGQPRAKKYSRKIIELFEPVVTAKAGSVRLFLHQSPPIRRSEYDRSLPLRLLANLLRAAAAGDSDRVSHLLKETAEVASAALYHLESIVKISAQDGDVTFDSSDATEQIALDRRALSALQRATTPSKPIVFTRTGSLYCLEYRRGWCRLSSFEDQEEYWTLHFSDHLKEKVRGRIPRTVTVSFEAEKPAESNQGKGVLVDIAEAPDS